MSGEWHEPQAKVAGVEFDRQRGSGWTSLNHDIDYFGLTVLMKPSVFMALALPLNETNYRESSLNHHKELIARGGGISPGFFQIEWSEDAGIPMINGHEGRHRMLAVQETVGDVPVPVHLTVQGRRARSLTRDDVDLLRARMVAENRGFIIDGPLFGDACLNKQVLAGAQHEGAIAQTRVLITTEAAKEYLALLIRKETGGTRTTLGSALDSLEGMSRLDLWDLDDWFMTRSVDSGTIRREIRNQVEVHGAGLEVEPYLDQDLIHGLERNAGTPTL